MKTTKGGTDPTMTTAMPLGPNDNPSARGLAEDDLSNREEISQITPEKQDS